MGEDGSDDGVENREDGKWVCWEGQKVEIRCSFLVGADTLLAYQYLPCGDDLMSRKQNAMAPMHPFPSHVYPSIPKSNQYSDACFTKIRCSPNCYSIMFT